MNGFSMATDSESLCSAVMVKLYEKLGKIPGEFSSRNWVAHSQSFPMENTVDTEWCMIPLLHFAQIIIQNLDQFLIFPQGHI